VQRLKKALPDIFYLALIVGAFVFVGQRLFGSPTSGWETDFDNTSIDMDEVMSGGVPRDGIPPIDDPTFEKVKYVMDLLPQSPIISLEINGDARAYPLEVLTRHEIVNDEVGGIPVAVTYCPLCNSAIVYDRRVDGEILRFGVSGNLRNSDLIMWDDKTESWWQQLTGEGIVGDYNGYMLDMIPSQVISFGMFAERYPDGHVLRGPYGGYGRNPYVGYDTSSNPFLFRGQVDKRLSATERVLAVKIDGDKMAYAFSKLSQEHVVNDTVNDMAVVVFWQAGVASALDAGNIDDSRDVGMALMYQRTLPDGTVLTFRYENGQFRDNATDSIWNMFGECIKGRYKGESLKQVNAYPHLWFAWAAFHPDTELYKA